MTIYSRCIHDKLTDAFRANHMFLFPERIYFEVKNSSNTSQDKVREIIKSLGFCPLISRNSICENIVFTVSPFKIPDFFLTGNLYPQNALKPATIHKALTYRQPLFDNYFDFDEMTSLLNESKTISNYYQDISAEGKTSHAAINEIRVPFKGAMEKGLFEIICPNALEKYPIVEIGAGSGYNIPSAFSARTIRIQPHIEEFQKMKDLAPKTTFQLNIEDFCKILSEKHKKISEIFLLNVFDTLSDKEKQINLTSISVLQNPGDKLHILLDVNPCLYTSIEGLKRKYPGFMPMPFIHEDNICQKVSYALIPEEFTTPDHNRSAYKQFIEDVHNDYKNLNSQTQTLLRELYKKKLIQVIAIEDFFVEKMKEMLENTGYSSTSHYHHSFTVEVPNSLKSGQELIYKPVTDAGLSVRQWKLYDKRFVNWLKDKNLNVPEFASGYVKHLKTTDHRILGAEFLVIEATKR